MNFFTPWKIAGQVVSYLATNKLVLFSAAASYLTSAEAKIEDNTNQCVAQNNDFQHARIPEMMTSSYTQLALAGAGMYMVGKYLKKKNRHSLDKLEQKAEDAYQQLQNPEEKQNKKHPAKKTKKKTTLSNQHAESKEQDLSEHAESEANFSSSLGEPTVFSIFDFEDGEILSASSSTDSSRRPSESESQDEKSSDNSTESSRRSSQSSESFFKPNIPVRGMASVDKNKLIMDTISDLAKKIIANHNENKEAVVDYNHHLQRMFLLLRFTSVISVYKRSGNSIEAIGITKTTYEVLKAIKSGISHGTLFEKKYAYKLTQLEESLASQILPNVIAACEQRAMENVSDLQPPKKLFNRLKKDKVIRDDGSIISKELDMTVLQFSIEHVKEMANTFQQIDTVEKLNTAEFIISKDKLKMQIYLCGEVFKTLLNKRTLPNFDPEIVGLLKKCFNANSTLSNSEYLDIPDKFIMEILKTSHDYFYGNQALASAARSRGQA